MKIGNQFQTDSGVHRTLAYDANGNLTNDGAGKTYTYDAADSGNQ